MGTRRWAGLAVLVAGLAAVSVGFTGAHGQSLRAGPTQMVSDDPEQAINSNTSPLAVVDPHRPDVLVVAARVDAPRLDCTVTASTTGGEAWRRLTLPMAPGASNCFWPDVAFTDDGGLLVLYTPTGGEYDLPLGLWLQRFTPDLVADGPPVQVSGPLTFEPRLAVAGSRVLATWIAARPDRLDKALGFTAPPNPILLARSDDGGRTFGPAVTVDDPGRLAVQPTLLAGPDSRVVVGALDLGTDLATYETADGALPGPAPTGPWRVVAWTSTDGGATFGPATVVADHVVPGQRVLIDLAAAPAFALDPARGRAYAAWESAGDVDLSRSDDGGRTWSAPRRVGPAKGTQFLPGIGVAPDGRVDVAFYDRSRDRADVMADVVLASSADGGRSFVTTTVSDQPFDSRIGSFTGDNVMLGSHLAVVSEAGRTTVVWPDGARGNRVNNIVDLTSAAVAVRPAGGGRRPVAWLGGVLAVAGIGLLVVPMGRRQSPTTGRTSPG